MVEVQELHPLIPTLLLISNRKRLHYINAQKYEENKILELYDQPRIQLREMLLIKYNMICEDCYFTHCVSI